MCAAALIHIAYSEVFFTHCILVDSSSVMSWTSLFVTSGVSGLYCHFYFIFSGILLANNIDHDRMPHYVASDLGLHCLPMTLLQVSR